MTVTFSMNFHSFPCLDFGFMTRNPRNPKNDEETSLISDSFGSMNLNIFGNYNYMVILHFGTSLNIMLGIGTFYIPFNQILTSTFCFTLLRIQENGTYPSVKAFKTTSNSKGSFNSSLLFRFSTEAIFFLTIWIRWLN